MRIYVTGTRGLPNIPGGVEKHCQELYPLIAAKGHDVICATRASYVTQKQDVWNGVRLHNLPAPRIKTFEAIVHTFLAVVHARMSHPDLVHIHAIGPGLMIPLARLLGLKVVFTHHGPDYERQKWNRMAKWMLRLGEYLALRFSNGIIAVSGKIADGIRKRDYHPVHLIRNGVSSVEKSKSTDFLKRFGLSPQRYILTVCRFVPEKGLHDLIAAFESIDTECHLVIAGAAEHKTKYSQHIESKISKNNRIVGTGFQIGEPLRQLFSHARLFVLPSYHEGMPITLLEAISYGLDVLVSDIPANLELDLPPSVYFKSGSQDDLKDRLKTALLKSTSEESLRNRKSTIDLKYNWSTIADQTLKMYAETLKT